MKTCLPVTGYKGDETIEVFEGRCIHINFKRGFSKVAEAHKIINCYAAEHLIKLSDRVYEVYNKDMSVDVYYAL